MWLVLAAENPDGAGREPTPGCSREIWPNADQKDGVCTGRRDGTDIAGKFRVACGAERHRVSVQERLIGGAGVANKCSLDLINGTRGATGIPAVQDESFHRERGSSCLQIHGSATLGGRPWEGAGADSQIHYRSILSCNDAYRIVYPRSCDNALNRLPLHDIIVVGAMISVVSLSECQG